MSVSDISSLINEFNPVCPRQEKQCTDVKIGYFCIPRSFSHFIIIHHSLLFIRRYFFLNPEVVVKVGDVATFEFFGLFALDKVCI